jgi:hypothetical protein
MGEVGAMGIEPRERSRRRLPWVPLALALWCATLAAGATAASPASAATTSGGIARSVGGCKIVANPTSTNFTKCPGATLNGASLSNANLNYADLAKANLSGANLANATLVAANLGGANLTGANLTGANLSQATLKDATLDGVTWSNSLCPDSVNSASGGGSCSAQLSPAAPQSDPVGAPGLAFTGTDLLPLVVTGTGLIAVGFLLLGVTRRRTGALVHGR